MPDTPINRTVYGRRHLLTVLVATVVLLAAVALFNMLVDPYRMYSDTRAKRPYTQQQANVLKGYWLGRNTFNTLLLGNSRVEIGFDPEDPAWPT